MALLFHVRDFFYSIGFIVLITIAVVVLLRFLLSRERRNVDPKLRKLAGITGRKGVTSARPADEKEDEKEYRYV